MIKKIYGLIFLSLTVFLASCAGKDSSRQETSTDGVSKGKSIIVDVRTLEEWNDDGHASCTVNIPLNELSTKLDSLRDYDNILVVCRSGNRSAQAKSMLEEAGFNNVTNGGAWQSVTCP
jgi:rhodanese-related sulfurtransferase